MARRGLCGGSARTQCLSPEDDRTRFNTTTRLPPDARFVIRTAMKAIGIKKFGGPEALEVVELPEPHAGPGEAACPVRGAQGGGGMSVSTKTRFEVFKRDRFTCAYCGRTPPEVLLHVDHIIPKVDGGPDDIENLVTACQDCNLGKGARPLASRPASGPTAAELEERIEQAKQYLALMSEVRDIRDQLVDLVGAPGLQAPERLPASPQQRELALPRVSGRAPPARQR